MFCLKGTRSVTEYQMNIVYTHTCVVFFHKTLNLPGCFHLISAMMYVVMRENKGAESSQIGKHTKISDDMN